MEQETSFEYEFQSWRVEERVQRPWESWNLVIGHRRLPLMVAAEEEPWRHVGG